MRNPVPNHPVSLLVLRWTARLLSLLALGVFVMFAIGEGLNLAHFSAFELVLFVFFPFGVCLGMVLAWRWEGLGGAITIASLAAFYLLARPRGYAFLVLAVPGFLFLLCWLWARLTTKHHTV